MNRKPFQGVLNIIRFNWHFYVISVVLLVLLIFVQRFLPQSIAIVVSIAATLAAISIFVSLVVSYYVYDASDFYSLDWINKLNIPATGNIVNINAGFDETSELLKNRFPDSNLQVFDFYDPAKHTEISIERARKAYPPFNGTVTIETNNVLLKRSSVDVIFLILAVHEIRNNDERTEFFKQLASALSDNGRIVIVEHQRDIANFLAFNIGFFHFHSHKTWLGNFKEAGLSTVDTIKHTPFLNIFNLKRK
ncbi:MAG: methyltransferase [Ignavibacteria bacterium]|nr:methyltransferase [Ignavibacteria bacterium]